MKTLCFLTNTLILWPLDCSLPGLIAEKGSFLQVTGKNSSKQSSAVNILESLSQMVAVHSPAPCLGTQPCCHHVPSNTDLHWGGLSTLKGQWNWNNSSACGKILFYKNRICERSLGSGVTRSQILSGTHYPGASQGSMFTTAFPPCLFIRDWILSSGTTQLHLKAHENSFTSSELWRLFFILVFYQYYYWFMKQY